MRTTSLESCGLVHTQEVIPKVNPHVVCLLDRQPAAAQPAQVGSKSRRFTHYATMWEKRQARKRRRQQHPTPTQGQKRPGQGPVQPALTPPTGVAHSCGQGFSGFSEGRQQALLGAYCSLGPGGIPVPPDFIFVAESRLTDDARGLLSSDVRDTHEQFFAEPAELDAQGVEVPGQAGIAAR